MHEINDKLINTLKSEWMLMKKKEERIKPSINDDDEHPCKGITIGTKPIFKFPKKPRKSITKRILKCIHKFTDGIKNFHTFPIENFKSKTDQERIIEIRDNPSLRRHLSKPRTFNPSKNGWYAKKHSKLKHFYLLSVNERACSDIKVHAKHFDPNSDAPHCKKCNKILDIIHRKRFS